MSKRLDRLIAWIDANPYQVYGDYNDSVSDDMAQMLIAGDFQGFDESWWEIEINVSDYTPWGDWESEFAEQAGYDSFTDMPQLLQDLAYENRTIDCSDLLKTSLRNWSGNVCARLIKRNGEYVEFPNGYSDPEENRKNQSYLKRHCGIDGWKAEATYTGTYLTVLGRIDLWELYQSQAKPESVQLDSDCFTIGHEPWNGSGTCGSDQYKGKPRAMRAKFFVDGKDGYGVDSIFGLTGKCWSNTIKVAS